LERDIVSDEMEVTGGGIIYTWPTCPCTASWKDHRKGIELVVLKTVIVYLISPDQILDFSPNMGCYLFGGVRKSNGLGLYI
jgi:hypothetical protein